jgi:uncharacterized protein DUF4442
MPSKLRKLKTFLRVYPPYLGAGVRITQMSDDFRQVDVEMRLRFWNKNYVGTHFGGSLYTMCDPFYMLMLIHNLGPDYIVWDKAATIRFKRPGKGTVKARFELSEQKIEEIRKSADTLGKIEPLFQVNVIDAEENVVAEVEKLLYVRRKDATRPAAKSPSGSLTTERRPG